MTKPRSQHEHEWSASTENVNQGQTSRPSELHVSTSAPSTIEEANDMYQREWGHNEVPDLPYKAGFVIHAKRHEPPAPFGLGYDTAPPLPLESWKDLSQVEHCLSQPPLDGRTDSSITKTMVITSTIRTGHDRGAQIVVVDRKMVGKIYDPLYYACMNEDDTKNDVVSDADGDYGREVAALEQLQHSSHAKSVTPAYYGSWTMMIETQVKRSNNTIHTVPRPVRFILEELIHGDCMSRINASELPDEVRSLILKECIVAETLVYDAGIDHRDFCARNIMIESSNYSDPFVPISDIHIKVKLIDFNVSVVMSHPMFIGARSVRDKYWPSKLASPIVRYFGDMMEFSTRGWCSNTGMEAEKWLWQHFRDDDRYAPVAWDFSDPRKRPMYRSPTATANDRPAITERSESSSNGSENGIDEKESGSSDVDSVVRGLATMLVEQNVRGKEIIEQD